MKNNKSPGKDRIAAKMLKSGGKTIREILYNLINKIQILNTWDEAINILLLKKVDRKDWKTRNQ